MKKIYAYIETKGKRIGFMMDADLQEALLEVLEEIPIYHCIRGFVEDCLASYGAAEERHRRDAAENETETVYSKRPYFLTDQQMRFIKSEEAEKMFMGEILIKKFLVQLRECYV